MILKAFIVRIFKPHQFEAILFMKMDMPKNMDTVYVADAVEKKLSSSIKHQQW